MAMKQREDRPSRPAQPPDSQGALAALRKATAVARRRAIETSGYVAMVRDGKIVHETTLEPPDRSSEDS